MVAFANACKYSIIKFYHKVRLITCVNKPQTPTHIEVGIPQMRGVLFMNFCQAHQV